MSAHAPTAPTTRPRRRLEAEHVVVAATVTLLMTGFALVFGDGLPHGKPVGTTCAWQGRSLVVSGGLINTGMSSAQFQIDARVSIAGRARPVRLWASADLSGFSAGRWHAAVYRYARKGLVGNAIEGCAAHVRTVPPPSGED
ncbi:MAG TPA: hypothetical protein VFI18_09845 [Gaiellales bacterium]|nr:hypothetical protein [Gaiellales bacterium]